MTWEDGDGRKLLFQYGDYARINVPTGTRVRFRSGYVRGYNLITSGDGPPKVAYLLYKMGHDPLAYVKEEVLSVSIPPYGKEHGYQHKPGEVCPLCGDGM